MEEDANLPTLANKHYQIFCPSLLVLMWAASTLCAFAQHDPDYCCWASSSSIKFVTLLRQIHTPKLNGGDACMPSIPPSFSPFPQCNPSMPLKIRQQMPSYWHNQTKTKGEQLSCTCLAWHYPPTAEEIQKSNQVKSHCQTRSRCWCRTVPPWHSLYYQHITPCPYPPWPLVDIK